MANTVNFDKQSRQAQADAIMEMAQKARLGGLIYLTGIIATIAGTPQLHFSHPPELLAITGFCCLSGWRELAYQLVSRGQQQALRFFWVYKSCFFVMALAWITFVLYVLAVAEHFEGVPALMVVATAGFSSGTIVVLVPHLGMVRWFLGIMLILPLPFLPFILETREAWYLIVVDTLSLLFLDIIARKQTGIYWQRVELAERFQHQAEALRRSQEKALAASRAKSDFLAKMSHEIRTPMNGVIGMVQLLDETTADQKQKEFIEIIRSSGKALLTIINDILDFSKLEAGKVVLHSKPTDLAGIVRNIQSIFIGQAQEKQIDIQSSIQPLDNSRRVLVDPLRIQQLLFNLVGNAVKFTPSGKITIALTYEAIDSEHCRVVLSVEDTGIGVAPSQIERIFEQFEQAESSDDISGTGLGLSICKKLTELMNGEISVQSEPGVGSTFRVEIPAEWIEIEAAGEELPLELTGQLSASQADSDRISTLQVLVVEDNVVNQQVIRHLLNHIGCGVEVIDSGVKAIDLRRQRDFDIVLMDCDMPHMDGYETTRRIRQWEAESGAAPIPIIALTAHVIDSVRQKCFAAGMNDFLIKPAKLPVLENILIKYGSGNSADEWPGPGPG